ncbi:hypothetical protein Clacol_003201 [Clathrus columnatus]|uniref:Uncharacterized protein n=1 Tax=Clathrus columnatus TaxID=1419009 RepID=A0AAV5AAM0_9AGAM|nr:hypothetical protein Clacol_003201 [Clathrus columnatus]
MSVTATKRSDSFNEDEKYDPESGKHLQIDDVIIAEVAGAFFDDPNLDRDNIELEDDSPYPEVRSAVANTDDVDIGFLRPCGTLRAWIIGIIAAIIIPGMEVNPGPFSIKEHVLVTMMATVAYQSAYATDIIAVQRTFYNQEFNFACT